MFCEKCGTKIENEGRFCPNCGAAVGKKMKNAAAPAMVPRKLSNKKKLAAVAAGMAVLVSAGVIVLIVHITSPEYRSGKCVKKAEKYMQEEAFQEAIEAYREALDYIPDNETAETGLEDAYLGAAGALYQEADYEAAMEHYETVRGLNPGRFEVYLGESDIYLQSQDVIAALGVLEEGMEFVSGNALATREEYIKEHTVAYVSRVTAISSSGEVKMLGEYEYDEEGNQTKQILYNNGGVHQWNEYEYDEEGNQTKEIRYNADGSVDYWWEYECNTEGNRIKEIRYNADGNVDVEQEYEYDAEGNKIKYISYWGNGSVICWYEYEYDTEGNRIKERRYNADGSIDWEYEYDAEGNQIKYISHNADGSIYVLDEYEYDAEGNRIKYIRYNADGSVDRWWEYEYDMEGNQIKDISFQADGSVSSWYEYEYDAEGNQIKYISLQADGSVNRWYEYEYPLYGIDVMTVSIPIMEGMTNATNSGHPIKWVICDASGNVNSVCYDCEIIYHFTE